MTGPEGCRLHKCLDRAERFRERGMSVSFGWDPTPSSPLGLTAKVAPSWGGAATGGAEALWGGQIAYGMGSHQRPAAERLPPGALQKASSRRHAIPGCETIRVSRPSCFLGQGEAFNGSGESHHGTNGWITVRRSHPRRPRSRPRGARRCRPPATWSRPSAGRGSSRGRSGRWSPSRQDRAGGSSCCAARSRAGRSARPTRARRSTTAPSPTSTTPAGVWRVRRRSWSLRCCSSS